MKFIDSKYKSFILTPQLLALIPNYRGQKTRFHSPLNSTAVLNLNCSLLFFLNSFSLYFFEKSTKNGATVYGIRCFLCSRVALRHLSVGAHLAARCLSQCLGWQELASLKHHATCFQALLGCSLCLPTLPFRFQRRITFCNKNSLVCITDFNAQYANILKPAPS